MIDSGSLVVIQRQFWIVLASLLVASISFFRTLDALKYTSMVSVVFVLAMTVVIILYSMGIEGMSPCKDYSPPADDLEAVCVGEKER
jgi:amino acid permease